MHELPVLEGGQKAFRDRQGFTQLFAFFLFQTDECQHASDQCSNANHNPHSPGSESGVIEDSGGKRANQYAN